MMAPAASPPMIPAPTAHPRQYALALVGAATATVAIVAAAASVVKVLFMVSLQPERSALAPRPWEDIVSG